MITRELELYHGPQHLGMVGNFSITLSVEGDTIVEAKANPGYLHRGFEKLMEYRSWTQNLTLPCRINVVEPDSMEMIYMMGVESLARIEVPERAQYIRTIVLELSRLASHLFGAWAYANMLGFDTVAQWAMAYRDFVLDLFEELTGGRVYHMYIWPGGVRRDIPEGFEDKVLRTMDYIEKRIDDYDRMMFDSAIFQKRAQGVGVITKEKAMEWGVVGAPLRGCGIGHDVRKDNPYDAYDKLDFEMGIFEGGDVWARARVRQFEIRQTISMIRQLIHSGHIDCLHSYGDLAITRDHAKRALDELDRHGCKIKVWVDHSVAPTNFGSDIMRGSGDLIGAEAYHADLTLDYGVRYICRGRVSSILGQDIPARYAGLFNPHHPITSSKTLAKELVKRFLSRCGSRKYAMHKTNQIMRPIQLRNGARVYEFIRSNPHWGGVSSCDTAREISHVLNDAMLMNLVQREGICILYTHLGKGHDSRVPLDSSAVASFKRLADYFTNKKILVMTTYRLLQYLTVRDHLRYRTETGNGKIVLTIESVDDPIRGSYLPTPDELQGITWTMKQIEPEPLHVQLGGKELPVETHQADGKTFLKVPWRKLEYPDI